MFTMRIHAAVAAGIAGLAFAAGQIVPGLGMIVAAGGSTAWTAWATSRGCRGTARR